MFLRPWSLGGRRTAVGAPPDGGEGPFVSMESLEWDEPTTSVDGSPLTDLKGFYVTYVLDGSGDESSPPLFVAATGPEGGGHIVTSVPVTLPDAAPHSCEFRVRSIDLAEQVSDTFGSHTRTVQAD